MRRAQIRQAITEWGKILAFVAVVVAIEVLLSPYWRDPLLEGIGRVKAFWFRDEVQYGPILGAKMLLELNDRDSLAGAALAWVLGVPIVLCGMAIQVVWLVPYVLISFTIGVIWVGTILHLLPTVPMVVLSQRLAAHFAKRFRSPPAPVVSIIGGQTASPPQIIWDAMGRIRPGRHRITARHPLAQRVDPFTRQPFLPEDEVMVCSGDARHAYSTISWQHFEDCPGCPKEPSCSCCARVEVE